MNSISEEIDEMIEISDSNRWETKNLKLIQSLKKKFGSCSCKNKKLEHGVLTPPHYNCIKFSQCKKCKAYLFSQNYIYELLEILKKVNFNKEMEKKPKEKIC